MCGASLLPTAPQPPARNEEAVRETAPASARDSAAQPVPASPRATVRVPAEPPVISGPSFLGLNQPAPSGSGRKSNLGHGSHLERSSGSLDYLLEDDEERSSRGAGKIFLILVALALAVGLGYLRWRHDGLSALMSGAKKSPAVEQSSSESGPGASAAAPSTGTDTSSSSNANPAPSGAPSQPAITAAPDASSGAATGNPPPENATSGGPDAASSGTGGGAATTPPVATPAAPPVATKDESGAAGDSSKADADPNRAPSGAASVPKHEARSHAPPKPTPVTPRDPVSDAERYIYGRGGARQDCDRGLRMLRPAADQANPRAMISLGALYSTGVCTPRDLPTAYRWFALALRKQPENQPLQENLQRLWSQMTQPERQLAIKLSQ